jgi:protein dithiol:quinone oxidoreductase
MLAQRRLLNFAGALACAALLGFALYAQYALHLEPCPLCMFQRIGVAVLGVVFLVAAIHNPRGWGVSVYAVLSGLAALATIGVAARHVYIQSQPPGTFPACGAPLEVLFQMFPAIEVIRKVLRAGGECAVINWTFLGLSMPAWVLLCALVLGALALIANRRPAPQRPPGSTRSLAE